MANSGPPRTTTSGSHERFYTLTGRHFFCKACGIYPFHRKRVTPDFLGVNVFGVDAFDPFGIPVRHAAGAPMD